MALRVAAALAAALALLVLLAHLVAPEEDNAEELLAEGALLRSVLRRPRALAGRRLADVPTCPAEPLQLADLHSCSEAGLGQELLADVGLAVLGTGRGNWGKHVDQLISGSASISFGAPGASLNIESYPDPEAYKILLYQALDLGGNASYELCVHAGSDSSGNAMRFAVDGDETNDFEVPGGLERAALDLPEGGMATGCFQFSLTDDVQNYSGRVALEFGNVIGDVAVCQASLRRCSTPNIVPQQMAACPAQAEPLRSAWRCPEEDMGPELLAHFDFPSGSLGAEGWGYHVWEQDGAAFRVSEPGALVTVRNRSDPQAYDVQLFHDVELNASGSATYELCVQAMANESGSVLRFAVDSGSPDFEVPGALDRTVLRLSQGTLSTSCFRFVLDASANPNFRGRVDLEFGSAVGEVSVCQASLRRCNLAPAQALSAVRRCYTAPLESGGGCSRLDELQGSEFGLNRYGQETTGKSACLRHLREAGGNTFAFAAGRCELWTCPSRGALLNSSTGPVGGAQVFSELCDYQEPVAGQLGTESRSPVFVKLWEWNFADVARECEEYLGPNGFDAVQVAPVMEHITGPEWFTKYQPVSFRLDSRSGTVDDLRNMVARCRAAGVSVVVDVVLNHVAKPCDAVREVGDAAETPCRGYANSGFGNRRLAVLDGWDAVTPESFHHVPDSQLLNCAVDPETFQCPDSDPPNDCTLCDFYGLPDWNTALPSVQALLSKHLEELHEMGVTMIRLDAASYVHLEELSTIINRMPWDLVFQEWWRGIPEPARTEYVGTYRDIFLGRKIVEIFTADDMGTLPDLLNLTGGIDGVPATQALYPLTFHDQRTLNADRAVATYKNGLEFHQQQKFLLAWPSGVTVRLWGGFGWETLDDGPPGCDEGDERCQPTPVFSDSDGQDLCMETPKRSPLDVGLAASRRWVCEHRWTGVAGLVGFRKACRGLPISRIWDSDAAESGNLAYRTGDSCFVAIQRKKLPLWRRHGDWDLTGLETGLPPGRYCDVSSLGTRLGWDRASCPREVVLGEDGVVESGWVPEGDLLAIHAGDRLDGDQTLPLSSAPRAVVSVAAILPLVFLLGSRPPC